MMTSKTSIEDWLERTDFGQLFVEECEDFILWHECVNGTKEETK